MLNAPYSPFDFERHQLMSSTNRIAETVGSAGLSSNKTFPEDIGLQSATCSY
jgi:hypothetical protein